MLVAQLCSTLCDPMDCSPQGSPVHGISQVRILEWVAIPFSGDLPNPGIEPPSPALQADSLIGVGGKLGPCHYSEGAAFTNVSLANQQSCFQVYGRWYCSENIATLQMKVQVCLGNEKWRNRFRSQLQQSNCRRTHIFFSPRISCGSKHCQLEFLKFIFWPGL